MTDVRTDTDRDLRAIAEKATPGPWWSNKAGLPNPEYVFSPYGGIGGRLYVVGSSGTKEDRAHIAAWSPDRALAALDVIESVRDYHGQGYCYTSEGQIDRARDPRGLICDKCSALARWDALRGEKG